MNAIKYQQDQGNHAITHPVRKDLCSEDVTTRRTVRSREMR